MPEQKQGDDDEVRERFAGVQREAEEVELAPDRRGLPEPPQVQFKRPTLPQVNPVPESRRGEGGGLSSGDLRGFGLASVAGVQLVVSILVGAGLGWVIDRYLLRTETGATPWGLIFGFFLGIAAGFVQLIRLVNQINRDE